MIESSSRNRKWEERLNVFKYVIEDEERGAYAHN